MNLEQLRARQCQLLRERIAAIGRIRHGIHYTLGHLPSPVPPTDQLDDAQLEALAAFNERFGKLQDLVAATMKQASLLSGADSDTFPQVLSYMTKRGIVEDEAGWKNLRMLRNLGAHEYDLDPHHQAEYFNTLLQELPALESIADRLVEYCRSEIDCD